MEILFIYTFYLIQHIILIAYTKHFFKKIFTFCLLFKIIYCEVIVEGRYI